MKFRSCGGFGNIYLPFTATIAPSIQYACFGVKDVSCSTSKIWRNITEMNVYKILHKFTVNQTETSRVDRYRPSELIRKNVYSNKKKKMIFNLHLYFQRSIKCLHLNWKDSPQCQQRTRMRINDDQLNDRLPIKFCHVLIMQCIVKLLGKM